MVNKKVLGENLRKLREGSGYNQESIAKFLGLDQTMISKIENGERSISVEMLDKLSSLFGVSTHDIVNNTVETKQLARAFRRIKVSDDDLEAISAINKIALNSEFMNSLLEGNKA